MNSQDFSERWLNKERDLGLGEISDGLVVNGLLVLPASAAPCLSFEELRTMPRIQDQFNLEGWPVEELASLEPYRMIGADGAGNPICVEEKTGEIWLLDHEDHFRTRQFVNSSIADLAESLLAYMVAFIGKDKSDALMTAIAVKDSRAVTEGSFWWHEARTL